MELKVREEIEQEVSDRYKDAHGFRPRFLNGLDIVGLLAMLDELRNKQLPSQTP